MRVPAPVLAGLALVGVAAAMVAAGRSLAPDAPRPELQTADPVEAPLAPQARTPSVPAEADPARGSDALARRVGQGGFAPPLPAGVPLERAAPRAPLSQLARAEPPKPPDDEWPGRLLPRPVAPSAGVIQAGGFEVRLAGIEPLTPEATCGEEDARWACGMHARTAFRALLRARSVICEVPEEQAPGTIEARCRIGKRNLAAWLVANGWARASRGGPFEAEGSQAEQRGRGMFGPPPGGDEPPASYEVQLGPG